jgi:glyoxylase-like metal-dependent hydrolase (beta-lactamase superfamily II)
MSATIQAFFDQVTSTYSYVVSDAQTRRAVIIDSVLDYDPAAGAISTHSADVLLNYTIAQGLQVDYILETHVHADHLSAAHYLQPKLGGKVAIGANIGEVQKTFGPRFNAGASFATDGSQFDALFADGDVFMVGTLEFSVMHTPGHTPACVTYLVSDAAFVGDTLFMPDYGTARCDFPGGDAETMYESLQKILALPEQTRLFMCHDYLPEGRSEYQNETTVAAELNNVHLVGKTKAEFIFERQRRDATLPAPRLLLSSIQVNMRAGVLPQPEENGISYLKIPLRGAT